jgi:hypothetical protein
MARQLTVFNGLKGSSPFAIATIPVITFVTLTPSGCISILNVFAYEFSAALFALSEGLISQLVNH